MTATLSAQSADLLIAGYQRYLSPYKGFCCAYREHTGRASCSMLGRRVIRARGLFSGLVLLSKRFRRCSQSAAVLQAEAQTEAPLEAPSAPDKTTEKASDKNKSACTAANASCCIDAWACLPFG
jgi:putative component of membrane protein insertase Oxa1/YidC/SpoIIIJ protein YidD